MNRDFPPPEIIPYHQEAGVTLHHHVIYPDRNEHALPGPAIMFFFCGAWKQFDPAKFFPQSYYLASRGLVCINTELRTASRHGATAKQILRDAKTAINWVRSHARALNIDPEKIVASGGSTSGLIAFMSAIDNGIEVPDTSPLADFSPDALVLFNPTIDLSFNANDVKIVGNDTDVFDLSPKNNVTEYLPPILIMQGDNDKLTPVEFAQHFADKVQAAGNRCELLVYPGKQHGFFNFRNGYNPMFTQTMRDTDDFLHSLGWLDGKPDIDNFVEAVQRQMKAQ